MPRFRAAWGLRFSLVVCVDLGTSACDRVYYSTMKRFGMEKRDILVDRVRDAQKAQAEAKDEFQTALERFKSVIEVEESSLEKKYKTLSRELERSEDKAKRVHDRINAVRDVSEDLPDRSAIAIPRPTPLPPVPGQTPPPATADNRELWARDGERFNDLFGTALNSHRASIGLAPDSDVRSHVFTDRPWLAADPTLAPWPDRADQAVFQTGAWILPDERPLSPELWSQRIHHLGIGTAHASCTPTTDSLTGALEHALQPDVATRARSIATAVRRDGARAAAERLINAPQTSF